MLARIPRSSRRTGHEHPNCVFHSRPDAVGRRDHRAPAHAQLFGESDEEKAARQAHEDGQDTQINQLGGRVQQLEDGSGSLTESLSTATGANEELAHQIQELRQKIDAQQKDFAYRLCMLSAQQLGADASDQGLNCGAVGATAAPAPAAGNFQNCQPGTPLPPIGGDNQAAPPPSSGAQQFGRPPGTLGTLPSGPGGNGAMNGAPPRVASAAPARAGDQFNVAMNLLAKAQYAEATRRLPQPMPTPIRTTMTCRRKRSTGSAISLMCSTIIPAPRAPSPSRSRNIPTLRAVPTVC